MTADILALYKKIKQKKRLREYRKLEILPSDSIYQSLSIERRVMSNHRRVQIGHKSVINGKFIFESRDGDIEIGDRTCIGYATIICRNSVTIGNDVNIAWNCLIYDHDSNSLQWNKRKNEGIRSYDAIINGRNIYEDKDWDVVPSEPIKICDKVWIGANVTILKGVTIGEGAVVGIGSVVTHDVPPWTLVAGNPARIIRRIDC